MDGPIPSRTVMYAHCGPHMGMFPQCKECKIKQGDSKEPVFCGRLFPVVYWDDLPLTLIIEERDDNG